MATLRIDLAIPTFGSFPFTTTYTVFESGRITGFDIIAESLPQLTSEVEQNFAEFSSGEIMLTARNDWGDWGVSAFTSASCDPTSRYPVCLIISVYEDNVLVFQGDVDLKSISFNRKAKTVSFTALGPLHRLEQWSAEIVRRTIPVLSQTGNITASAFIGGSDYYATTSTFWPTATVLANNCLIDKNGTIWTIVGPYGVGVGGVDKLRLTNPRQSPGRAYTQPVTVPPAIGSFTIRPMVFATRYDWQSDSGTLSVGSCDINGGAGSTYQYLQDTGKNLYNVGCWTYHWLEDSAGVFWQIVNTVIGAGGFINKYIVEKQGGYPSGPDITAHPWPGMSINAPTYSIRKSNRRNLLESMGPTIATLGLVGKTAGQEGDKLTLTTAGTASYTTLMAAFTTTAAQSQTYEIQFAGPKASGPPLADRMLWMMEEIEWDLLPTDGVTLATPYYRDKTPAELARLLFLACHGGSFAYNVNVVPYNGTDEVDVVKYADFDGKSVADALSELAIITNCSIFCTYSGGPSAPLATFNFQRRDAGKGALYNLSTPMPDGTIKITERQDGIAWEFYYPYISVTGANDTKVQQGAKRQGAARLEVSSDYINTYAWLHQVLARLWGYFGKRRDRTSIKVKGEAVVGLEVFGRVTLDGGDEWWPIRISRPMRQPVEIVEIDLINATGVSYTPDDYTEVDASSAPEPPVISSVTGTAGLNPKTATFRWPYLITSLLGFNRRMWGAAATSLSSSVSNRPVDPNYFIGVGGRLTVLANSYFSDAISALDLQIVMGGPPWYVEYETVLLDGRTSIPSVPMLVY